MENCLDESVEKSFEIGTGWSDSGEWRGQAFAPQACGSGGRDTGDQQRSPGER